MTQVKDFKAFPKKPSDAAGVIAPGYPTSPSQFFQSVTIAAREGNFTLNLSQAPGQFRAQIEFFIAQV